MQAGTDVDGQAEAVSAADIEAETALHRDWGRGQRGGDRVRRGARGEGSTAEQVEATASATVEKVETAETDKAEATAVGRPAGRRLDAIGGESTVHFDC